MDTNVIAWLPVWWVSCRNGSAPHLSVPVCHLPDCHSMLGIPHPRSYKKSWFSRMLFHHTEWPLCKNRALPDDQPKLCRLEAALDADILIHVLCTLPLEEHQNSQPASVKHFLSVQPSFHCKTRCKSGCSNFILLWTMNSCKVRIPPLGHLRN